MALLLITALTLVGFGSPARANGSVVATIDVGTEPYGITLSADGSTAYVANFDTGTVSVIDTGTRTVVDTIVLQSGLVFLVLSPDGSRLYATNRMFDKVHVIDTSNNTALSEISVSTNPEIMAISPDGSTGYVSAPTVGKVDIIDLATEAVTDITMGGFPVAIAVNSTGTRLYVTDAIANKLEVFGTGPYTPVATVPLGTYPNYLISSPDGSYLYAVNQGSDTVSEIDPTSNTVTRTLTAGNQPVGMAISPSGNRLYVMNIAGDDVSVIDIASGESISSIPVGEEPIGSAISPDGTTLYVTNRNSNSVSVIDVSTVDPAVSPSTSASYAYFTFLLPDGRECTSISPQRVQVGTFVELPGVEALCQTMKGSTVAGWAIPNQPGFTGYGSTVQPLPPGLKVRVIDSQRFTLVPFEPVLTIEYDANIENDDACTPANLAHASDDGRVGYSWVPRADFAMARTWSQAPCTPDGHEVVGWNTAGDGSGQGIELGAPLSVDWETNRANNHRLYAVWQSN